MPWRQRNGIYVSSSAPVRRRGKQLNKRPSIQREWLNSRTRGARRRQASDAAEAPVAIVEPVDWSLRAARFRWAELLRRIFEVDPLTCPRCQGLMRIVAVITEPAVITRILAHRVRARDPTPRLRGPLREGAAH